MLQFRSNQSAISLESGDPEKPPANISGLGFIYAIISQKLEVVVCILVCDLSRQEIESLTK